MAHAGVVYAFHQDGKYAITAGGRGDVTEAHMVWESKSGMRISSPVYHDGHLYWSNDGYLANCADAKTGKGDDCYASPVLTDGRLYYVSREKGIYVVEAKPKFELLAHNVIEDDTSVFNGSPAVRSGRLHLRSDKYLYCIGDK